MTKGKFLKLAECAEMTGHSISTWRAWVLKGRIQYFKIGGSIRISEADLENFIKCVRAPKKEQAAVGAVAA